MTTYIMNLTVRKSNLIQVWWVLIQMDSTNRDCYGTNELGDCGTTYILDVFYEWHHFYDLVRYYESRSNFYRDDVTYWVCSRIQTSWNKAKEATFCIEFILELY